MLNYTQVEKLEIARTLVHEVVESSEFLKIDYHPDVTLGDSIQGIDEALQTYYPPTYTPPRVERCQRVEQISIKITPVKRLRWGIADTLQTIALTSLLVAAVSASISVVFWGLSDIDKATGNKLRPDFAAESHLYRGVSIASVGLLFLSGVLAGIVNTKGGDE
jgi:hypothetical protein